MTPKCVSSIHRIYPSQSEIEAIVLKYLSTSRLIQCIPLSGGLFNESYLLIQANNEKTVLRISPQQYSLLSFEDTLLQAEKEATLLCLQHNLPVPHIIAVDDSLQIISRPFMLTSYINGQSLHKISIDMDKKKECFIEAGKVVRRIHSIVGEKFGRLGFLLNNEGFETWGEAILYEVYEVKKVIKSLNLLSEELLKAIELLFSKHLAVFNQITVPHLVHGDLWQGNILADICNDGCHFKAIIDADHAIWGDTEFEFPGNRQLNSFFEMGYNQKLREDDDSFIRRRLYLLLFSMKQCYVFKYWHNDVEQSNEQCKYIEQILKEFGIVP